MRNILINRDVAAIEVPSLVSPMSVTRNLIPNEDKKQDDTARDYENIVLELEDL